MRSVVKSRVFSGTSLRTTLMTSVSLMAITTGIGIHVEEANAQCLPSGNTLLCTGDVSAGFGLSSATINNIEIRDLTTDFERNGFTFNNSANADVTFDADLGTFSINHGNISNFRNFRNGLNIRTGGAIEGILIGDINGIDPGTVTSFGTNIFLNNFGALGLDAGGPINVTHTGTINVQRFDTVVRRDTAQTTTGRFGGIRAEADAGDIAITNSGDISVDGGTRTVTGFSFSSDDIIVQAIQFNNFLSDHIGIFVQGENDLTLTQTGDITTTGGGATAIGEAREARTGDVVNARVDGSRSSGIFIPRFTQTGGVINPNLPVFEAVMVDLNGNVSITGGEVAATAVAISGATTSDVGTAIAGSNLTSFGNRLAGVNVSNGSDLTVSVAGDVEVMGGTATASARTVSNDGTAQGFTRAAVRGDNVTGIEVRPNTRDASVPQTASLNVVGNVNVQGGTGTATADGNAIAEINTLIPTLRNFTPGEAVFAAGGSATGVSFTGQTFSLDGMVTAIGGMATGIVGGENLPGTVTGGRASGLTINLGTTDLSSVGNTAVTVTGGDAEIRLEGVNASGRVTGGGATVASFTGVGTLTQTARISGNGGNAVVTGMGNATATGGSVNGLIASTGLNSAGVAITAINQTDIMVEGGNATNSTSNATIGGTANGFTAVAQDGSNVVVRNDSMITATGGDATRAGPSNDTNIARGGVAVGVTIFQFLDVSSVTTTVENPGSIVATGGMGTDLRGAAVGISVDDLLFGTLPDGSIPSSDATVNITGMVAADGEGTEDDLTGALAQSTGVSVNLTGTSTVTVDGGTVASTGDRTHGLSTSSTTTNITLENGAEVLTAGTAAHGILITPNTDFDPISATQFRAVTTTINVNQGTTITSENGVGIFDNGNASEVVDDGTGTFVRQLRTANNQTTVDLSGTVTGGSGTAISLGSGNDIVNLDVRSGVVNGIIDGGTETDTFNFRGTGSFDINSIVNFENYVLQNGTTNTVVTHTGANPAVIPTGTTLLGNGTIVGNVNVQSGGAIAPSMSTGTININGDFALQAGSTFLVDINSDNTSDLITVNGTTMLGGNLQVNAIGALTVFSTANEYTIIDSAGAVSGSFANVTDNLPDLNVVASVVDGGDGGEEVQLNLVASSTPNPNPVPDPDPEPDPVVDPDPDPTLIVDPDPAPAPSSDDFSDKSIHPNSVQAGASSAGEFTNILQNRARSSGSGRSNAPASSTFALALLTNLSTASGEPYGTTQAFAAQANNPQGTFVWATGFGATRDVDGSPATTGFDADTGGIAFGVDHIFTHNEALITLGVAGSFANTDVDSGLGSADIDTWHIGAYGSLQKDNWLFSGTLGFGFQEYDFTRSIPIGAGIVTANGNADGDVFSASFAASHDIAPLLGWTENNTRFAPLVRFDHIGADRDGFTETGAGILNLTVADDHFTRNFISLGFETSSTFTTENGSVVRPSLEIRWEHAFNDDNVTSNAIIAGVAGANFTTIGAFEDDDRAVVGAGLDIDLSENVSANIRYDGTFASGFTDHGGSVGIRMKF